MSIRVEPRTLANGPVDPGGTGGGAVDGEPPEPAARPRRQPNTYRLLGATTAALVAMGLVMVLSASSVESYVTTGSSFQYFIKQLLGAALGVVALVVAAKIDYRRLRRFARPLFWLTLMGLVAVLLPGIGVSGGGSSRWIPLGPLTIQPSEMAKLALILVSAHMLERKGRMVGDFRELTMPVLPMTAIACLLMLIQPDLGTAVISLGSVSVVLYLAGARLRHLGAILGSGALMGGMLILSQGYQRQRFLAYLHPYSDPLKGGYQIIQGQIALGSGGLFGVGLGASRQKWSFLPNAHTDFIFAIIGEELGLVGAILVLAAFAYFVYLGIRIARESPDRFGTLVAAGITSWIGLQAIINIGAVTGILPVTGVPLPLISFGGTSLVVTMAGIGILLSIARQGQLARMAPDTVGRSDPDDPDEDDENRDTSGTVASEQAARAGVGGPAQAGRAAHETSPRAAPEVPESRRRRRPVARGRVRGPGWLQAPQRPRPPRDQR